MQAWRPWPGTEHAGGIDATSTPALPSSLYGTTTLALSTFCLRASIQNHGGVHPARAAQATRQPLVVRRADAHLWLGGLPRQAARLEETR